MPAMMTVGMTSSARLRATSPRMESTRRGSLRVVDAAAPARTGASKTGRSVPRQLPRAISAPTTNLGTADAPTPAAGPVPSLRELRASIPKECFEPDLGESLKYAAYDLAALAACFGVISPHVVDHPWLLPLYAPLTGTVMWMNFVVGHDCGHGSFSKSSVVNGVVGHLTHSPLLVPFYPWAYSHKQHLSLIHI